MEILTEKNCIYNKINALSAHYNDMVNFAIINLVHLIITLYMFFFSYLCVNIQM